MKLRRKRDEGDKLSHRSLCAFCRYHSICFVFTFNAHAHFIRRLLFSLGLRCSHLEVRIHGDESVDQRVA